MNKTVKIRNKLYGEGQPMMIIAEVASAHEGRFDDLLKLIDLAGETGADAVKFQILDAEAHMTPAHKIYDLVQKLQFSEDQWQKAIKYTRQRTDLLVLADAYDMGGVGIIKNLDVDMVKIHSADLGNVQLIEAVARLKKPALIGVGASTLKEITQALKIFYLHNKKDFLGLLHGYQGFPTRTEEMNMRQMATLRKRFRIPVGFLDHTEGDTDESLYIGVAACALGAFAIEKHIVLNRSRKGIDHESALSLGYFKKFVRWVRETEKALGSSTWLPLTEAEIKYREFMKKSIVARKDIQTGKKITKDMMVLKRSSPGLSGHEITKLVGRRANHQLLRNQNITLEDVQ